jgi:hypothetical protein
MQMRIVRKTAFPMPPAAMLVNAIANELQLKVVAARHPGKYGPSAAEFARQGFANHAARTGAPGEKPNIFKEQPRLCRSGKPLAD